jgi:hypothetical protein
MMSRSGLLVVVCTIFSFRSAHILSSLSLAHTFSLCLSLSLSLSVAAGDKCIVAVEGDVGLMADCVCKDQQEYDRVKRARQETKDDRGTTQAVQR